MRHARAAVDNPQRRGLHLRKPSELSKTRGTTSWSARWAPRRVKGYLIEPAGFSHDRGIARLGSVEAAGAGAQSRAFRVGTRTLDGLSAERDIGLLKIDVEGGEYDVLRGAASRLQRRAIRDIVFEDFAPPSSSAAIALLSQPWVLGMGHRAIVPQADPGSEGEQRGATRLGITQLHRDDPASSNRALSRTGSRALP